MYTADRLDTVSLELFHAERPAIACWILQAIRSENCSEISESQHRKQDADEQVCQALQVQDLQGYHFVGVFGHSEE